MAKPIYAGSYSNRGRGRWKKVFAIIVLLQIVIVGAFLYFKKDKNTASAPSDTPVAAAAANTDLPAAPLAPASPTAPVSDTAVSTPESKAVVADAQAAVAGGQLMAAKTALDKLVATTPDPDAIKLLGEVNMKLLKSPVMMPGKEYYTIQPGDYLRKIAQKFHTTVALIKEMNGLKTDNIRAGARLLVFNGNFSIRVSKSRKTLDLLANGKLFKRYSVGTGKFGKTPKVQFTIVDKITEPAWTRPSDNKVIEYGSEENPLGTRWMALKATDHPELTGFGIHGTWERNSIGKESSAGCIRMLNENVEELFDLVPRKTTVIITD